ncbi:MAG: hypothetical protein YYHSYBAR_002612 [Candidatus Fervidibacter sacchari]
MKWQNGSIFPKAALHGSSAFLAVIFVKNGVKRISIALKGYFSVTIFSDERFKVVFLLSVVWKLGKIRANNS